MSSYRYRDNDFDSSSSEDDDASTVSQDDSTRIIERTNAVVIEDEDYDDEEDLTWMSKVSVSVSSYESNENARQVQEISSSFVVEDGDDVREVLPTTVRRMSCDVHGDEEEEEENDDKALCNNSVRTTSESNSTVILDRFEKDVTDMIASLRICNEDDKNGQKENLQYAGTSRESIEELDAGQLDNDEDEKSFVNKEDDGYDHDAEEEKTQSYVEDSFDFDYEFEDVAMVYENLQRVENMFGQTVVRLKFPSIEEIDEISDIDGGFRSEFTNPDIACVDEMVSSDNEGSSISSRRDERNSFKSVSRGEREGIPFSSEERISYSSDEDESSYSGHESHEDSIADDFSESISCVTDDIRPYGEKCSSKNLTEDAITISKNQKRVNLKLAFDNPDEEDTSGEIDLMQSFHQNGSDSNRESLAEDSLQSAFQNMNLKEENFSPLIDKKTSRCNTSSVTKQSSYQETPQELSESFVTSGSCEDSSIVLPSRRGKVRKVVIIDSDDEEESDKECICVLESNENYDLDSKPTQIEASYVTSSCSSGATVIIDRSKKESKDSIFVDGQSIDFSTRGDTSTKHFFELSSSNSCENTVIGSVKSSATCRYDGWIYSSREDCYTVSKQHVANTFSIKMNLDCEFPKVSIPSALYNRLFDHQRVGVQWLTSLHYSFEGCRQKGGGLLADDMGLGKTFQTLTFLGGLMKSNCITCALVLAPLSCLESWRREAFDIIKSCKSDVDILSLSGNAQKRKEALRHALLHRNRRPCIAIASHGLATSPENLLSLDYEGKEIPWDYVVIDEGHKIKNSSSKTTKGCHRICRSNDTRRLLLTGTPIQNNLKELWTVFDWATACTVLGNSRRFAKPIEDGRVKDATKHTIRIAKEANEELQSLLKPYILQRSKSGVFKTKMTKKEEVVVWTHLSKVQRSMYEQFLVDSGRVSSILQGAKTSPLTEITWLKKLTSHPLLVSSEQNIDTHSTESFLAESAKLHLLVDLIKRLLEENHRCLIFSQSTKVLDIISKVLHFTCIDRIDGGTARAQRQKIMDQFNSGRKIKVLLLSTRAAGVGITLTGADRAIIYDPSWNPADDAQAVDRCYRIGQTKDVVVYRFIAAGTVEERMYEKQLHKDGIKNQIMSSKGNTTSRHFSKSDLQKLFTLGPVGVCSMINQFGQNIQPSKINAFLVMHPQCLGLSDHSVVYKARGATELEESDRMTSQARSEPFGSPQPKWARKIKGAAAINCSSSGEQENKNPMTRNVVGKSARILRDEKIASVALDIIPLVSTKLNKGKIW